MNVSRTMAPSRIIITHRYVVTTGKASLRIFFTECSFLRNGSHGRGSSGAPHALYRPGHRPDDRAQDGAGDDAAEEGGGAKDDRLQAGGERALEVAAEDRRAAVVGRHPEQLVDDRQHHAVGDTDGREGE